MAGSPFLPRNLPESLPPPQKQEGRDARKARKA